MHNIEEIIKWDIQAIFQNERRSGETENNFELIIQYYSTLSEEEKVQFKEIILQWKTDDNIEDSTTFPYFTISWSWFLIIKVSIYLWIIKELINKIYSKEDKSFYWLIKWYKDILATLHESDANIYAQKIIDILTHLWSNDAFIKDVLEEHIKTINNEILDWKLNKIRIKVNQVDIEIQSDQNIVMDLIEEFWFDPSINKFLTGLKSKNITEEDGIQFSWTINSFRDFFQKTIIEIWNKISETKTEVIPEYYNEKKEKIITPIWITRRYIKEKLDLSDNENKFIDRYIDIVHTEWWHSMFTSQEYFRLTKNIWIEILYMLLSKTKKILT